jgi:protein-S-isoprenylcysteine O-methyltransferase Ste14
MHRMDWGPVRFWLTVAVWACWAVFAGGAGVVRSRPGDRVDDHGTRAWADAATVLSLAAAILVSARLPVTAVPVGPWLAFGVGAAIVVLGTALRVWAARTLGRLFTQSVMVREGHRVISSGPYRFVRHPGYAGMGVSLVGLAVMLGNWGSVLVALLGFLAGHLPRIRVEERVLEDALGEEYRAYEGTHKRLVPGVW